MTGIMPVSKSPPPAPMRRRRDKSVVTIIIIILLLFSRRPNGTSATAEDENKLLAAALSQEMGGVPYIHNTAALRHITKSPACHNIDAEDGHSGTDDTDAKAPTTAESAEDRRGLILWDELEREILRPRPAKGRSGTRSTR